MVGRLYVHLIITWDILRLTSWVDVINLTEIITQKGRCEMEDKTKAFAALLEEHQRAGEFTKDTQNYRVSIKAGRKYTKIDVGNSGKYMVDKEGNIFGIKGYGVIHFGHNYGTLDTINDYWWGNYTAEKLN